jgi:hypothetical protein
MTTVPTLTELMFDFEGPDESAALFAGAVRDRSIRAYSLQDMTPGAAAEAGQDG